MTAGCDGFLDVTLTERHPPLLGHLGKLVLWGDLQRRTNPLRGGKRLSASSSCVFTAAAAAAAARRGQFQVKWVKMMIIIIFTLIIIHPSIRYCHLHRLWGSLGSEMSTGISVLNNSEYLIRLLYTTIPLQAWTTGTSFTAVKTKIWQKMAMYIHK